MRRRMLVALSALVYWGCGSSKSGQSPASGSDPQEDLTGEGLEQSVAMTEAELNTIYPLAARQKPDLPLPAALGPEEGAGLKARFSAYQPTRDPARYFTVIADAGVSQEFIARVKKGVLFGMENFETLLPDFSLFAATDGQAGGRPFDVRIFDTPHPSVGWRAYVAVCPNFDSLDGDLTLEDLLNDDGDRDRVKNCKTSLYLPYETSGSYVLNSSAGTFNHEITHLGHMYYTRSKVHAEAGGLTLGTSFHTGFSWQFEGSAILFERRAPESEIYQSLGNGKCPFEALRRGAFSWKDFSSVGTESHLPYQLGVLLDQITWHRFGNNLSWLPAWWTARPDARDPTRPESAGRTLLRAMSANLASVDLRALNQMLKRAGLDLYRHGKNPWTAQVLSSKCFQTPAGVVFDGIGPLSVNGQVNALAFDAVRIPIKDGVLPTLDKLKLKLEAAAGANDLRAAIYAMKVTPFVDCVQGLPDSALAGADPRSPCQKYLVPLGSLAPSNHHALEYTVPGTSLSTELSGYEIVAVVFKFGLDGSTRTPTAFTLKLEGTPLPVGATFALRARMWSFTDSTSRIYYDDNVYIRDSSSCLTLAVGQSCTYSKPVGGSYASGSVAITMTHPTEKEWVVTGSITAAATQPPFIAPSTGPCDGKNVSSCQSDSVLEIMLSVNIPIPLAPKKTGVTLACKVSETHSKTGISSFVMHPAIDAGVDYEIPACTHRGRNEILNWSLDGVRVSSAEQDNAGIHFDITATVQALHVVNSYTLTDTHGTLNMQLSKIQITVP